MRPDSIHYVMFHHVPYLPLIHFALEAHSVIEKGRRLVFFELWNEEYRDGVKQDRDGSLHYKAVK